MSDERAMKTHPMAKLLFWAGCTPWVVTAVIAVVAMVTGGGGTSGGMGFFMVLFFGGLISAVVSLFCWISGYLLTRGRDRSMRTTIIVLAVLLVVPMMLWGLRVLSLGRAIRHR